MRFSICTTVRCYYLAEYVIKVLEENGYEPTRQYFTVPVYSQVNASSFTASVSGTDYTWSFLEEAARWMISARSLLGMWFS
jgi:hypothetical protein